MQAVRLVAKTKRKLSTLKQHVRLKSDEKQAQKSIGYLTSVIFVFQLPVGDKKITTMTEKKENE